MIKRFDILEQKDLYEYLCYLQELSFQGYSFKVTCTEIPEKGKAAFTVEEFIQRKEEKNEYRKNVQAR